MFLKEKNENVFKKMFSKNKTLFIIILLFFETNN